MNDLTTVDAYGTVSKDSTLTIKRVLPGSIERVWAYLTESDLRRKWLAGGEMEMKVGAPFEFVWRNDELTDPPGKKPADFGEEHRMKCEITELDPPHKIGFTWSGSGNVTIELEQRSSTVLLTLIHRRITEKSTLQSVAPGWHAHLDVLAARVSATNPAPFWDSWLSLKDEYRSRLPA